MEGGRVREIADIVPCVPVIEGPLGRAHRRPSIYARHTIAGWRKEACNATSAIAGGRHHSDMHAMYLAGSVRCTYLCDVGFKSCESARSTFFNKKKNVSRKVS